MLSAGIVWRETKTVYRPECCVVYHSNRVNEADASVD